MNFWIYLLSICDQLIALRVGCLFVGAVCLVGWCISKGMTSKFTDGDMAPPRERSDLERARAWKASTYFGRIWVSALVLGILLSFFPSTKSVTRAYLMYHGAQVATADNAERAIGELVSRADRIIGIFEGKIEEPK
jgi:hypothetical protein